MGKSSGAFHLDGFTYIDTPLPEPHSPPSRPGIQNMARPSPGNVETSIQPSTTTKVALQGSSQILVHCPECSFVRNLGDKEFYLKVQGLFRGWHSLVGMC